MRSPRKTLFLTLILLATVLQLPLAMSDPGWLAGWDYRVKITIDSGDVDLPLTDFPILIYISDSSGINGENISLIFDEVGANSLKIAVTLSDGLTECYVEIEKWDLGNREAWVWSKISSISNITDTDLYLYYDNDYPDNDDHVGITNSVVAENVWDDNFVLVSHMRDDPDISHIRDSTQYDNDGTKKGAGEPALRIAGVIDGAQNFDGDNDYIGTGYNQDFSLARTYSVWFKTLDPEAFKGLMIDRGESPDGISINTGKLYFRVRGGASYQTVGTYNDDGDHRVTLTYDGGSTAKAYVNGVFLSDIGVGALEGSEEVTLGFRSLAKGGYFDGNLDEVRISNSVRSAEWEKASFETGRDHILDFGSEEVFFLESPAKLFGAGFNSSTPVVHLYWNSNLTGITLFEVQNSTDKISWDYLGSNTTREYHDFQVVNGTERYYRVRACNFTGGVWDNSTWSDINFETVYFISEVGEVYCKIRNFNASSITVIAGTLNDGNLASTFSVDGDWYNVSEINDIPGLDVRFNFTNIAGDPNCGCLDVYHSYTGHPQHDIKIQVWNFTSTSWYQIGTLIYNETAGWECSGLGNYAEHFFHNGSFWGRFYHVGLGHIPHEMQIDQIRLDVIYGEECPPCEEAPALLAMGKYYALAIILLVLGVLIGIGMRRKR